MYLNPNVQQLLAVALFHWMTCQVLSLARIGAIQVNPLFWISQLSSAAAPFICNFSNKLPLSHDYARLNTPDLLLESSPEVGLQTACWV